MANTLAKGIARLCPALAGLVTEGPGYGPTGVEVLRADVAAQGEGLCQTVVLRGPCGPLDAVEPLHLSLASALSEWEILHLGGGNSETLTPPPAYAPHRAFGLRRSYTIGREVGLWSSNFLLPMALVARRDGACGFFLAMEWSGDWRVVFEPEEGGFAVTLRIPADELSLADGQTQALPAAHFVPFAGGMEAGFSSARRYVRDHVSPAWPGGGRVPLVSYNSWDGIGDTVCRDNLMPQVPRAAELGVEVFLHDACWFAGGFPQGVGNYEAVDRSRWPDGLEPLADAVRERGMKFGLWFELERTVADGQAYAKHPELFLGYNSDGPAGQSLLLDLSKPEAQEWAFETVRRWVEPLGVEWIKWDFNFEPHRILRDRDATGRYVFAYVEGLYALLDRILERFPQLHIETCASGGRRFDLGMVRRSHTVWMSDHTDNAWNCRWMQFHANMFLPGQLLARSLPIRSTEGDERVMPTELLSRMMGRLQFDGWISRLSPAATQRTARLVAWYKEMRHLLLEDYRPLTPTPQRPGDPLAVAFASRDDSEAVVFAFAGDRAARVEVPWATGASSLRAVSVAGEDMPESGVGGGELRLAPHEARAIRYAR
jgi:alpha-galactosidase